jgi:altronate hydrolase
VPSRWLVANEGDNVAIALVTLDPGEAIAGMALLEAIPAGHKFAIRAIAKEQPVIKLGHLIGHASADISPGQHVHSHNLHFTLHRGRRPTEGRGINLPMHEASFEGFLRDDGDVGTRNAIAILTTVNCSATVAKRIAAHFTAERLALYPNVDGVVAFSHMSGCGMAKSGRGIENLQRTIAGYAKHPNFAAVLVVGLGCEVNQIGSLLEREHLGSRSRIQTLQIQDEGGTATAIQAGISKVQAMLPIANACKRTTVSAEHLTIGLQCGASDGYSGLTANPALGAAADWLVAAGGKVILSETPEIYGAEDLLLGRAASATVGQALLDRLEWWEGYAARDGADLNNNPSPGNRAGGITTILEKSLGAVAKAGTSPLNAVVDYAETVTEPGLTFMDSPGYDPCSATGQIAGGANLILFTTGRGSVFGSGPIPTIKLASNARLAQTMAGDIDVDCSPVLDGMSVAEMGDLIFQSILEIASGRQSASERHGIGENEWVPWIPGAMF